MVTLEQVLAKHTEVCEQARSLIEKKGHDYNREQQEQKGGDTLFNLTVAKILGIVKTTTQSILVRIGDKFMRLVSLTKDPSVNAKVADETVWETIRDNINYLIYLGIKYEEEREEYSNKLEDCIYDAERIGATEGNTQFAGKNCDH